MEENTELDIVVIEEFEEFTSKHGKGINGALFGLKSSDRALPLAEIIFQIRKMKFISAGEQELKIFKEGNWPCHEGLAIFALGQDPKTENIHCLFGRAGIEKQPVAWYANGFMAGGPHANLRFLAVGAN
jgi:hypothetical protein